MQSSWKHYSQDGSIRIINKSFIIKAVIYKPVKAIIC